MLHITVCFVYPQKSSLLAIWAMTEFSSAEANHRLPSECTTPSTGKRNERKTAMLCLSMCMSSGNGVCFSLRRFLFHGFSEQDYGSGPKDKPPIMVLGSPFSFPFTSLAYSSLKTKRLNPTPVADSNRSCKRGSMHRKEERMGDGEGAAGPASKIQRTRWKVSGWVRSINHRQYNVKSLCTRGVKINGIAMAI